MTPPLLSAALIVRDEARILEDCLASLGAVVDEIVVVDTGSGDDTVAVAERFGARVFHHPWHDDFAEARNVALDRVSGDWVLYIDADERFHAADRAAVEGVLAGSDAAAYHVVFYPKLGSTAYLEPRIWRNDPTIRFTGIIHETTRPSILALAEREDRPIGTTEFVIRHLGYEGDQRRKHLRNLPMLRRERERNPNNLFVRHHLFRVLDGLGEDAEAQAVLEEALALVETQLAAGVVDDSGSLILLEVIGRRGPATEGRELLALARTMYPDHVAFLLQEARVLIAERRYEEAMARADRVLEVAGRPPSRFAYDLALVGEEPREIKALCLFRMGRFAESAQEYAAAAALAPENPAYRAKRDAALGLARRGTDRAGGD